MVLAARLLMVAAMVAAVAEVDEVDEVDEVALLPDRLASVLPLLLTTNGR